MIAVAFDCLLERNALKRHEPVVEKPQPGRKECGCSQTEHENKRPGASSHAHIQYIGRVSADPEDILPAL
jgi:hypothetical protein